MSVDAAIGVVTVAVTWLLVAMIIAAWHEDEEESFFYPGKKTGERGIITTCRWIFITIFAPALLPLLILVFLGIILAPEVPKIPEATVKVIKWMIEEGE